jgi:hypothetical protein
MPRVKVPTEVQDQILIECRRRCTLCYALNQDLSAKVHGQIAHIDRNPENSRGENLAYLCLEHANLYDAKSKQSKGFTPGELRRYKADLLLITTSLHDPKRVKRIVTQEYRRAIRAAAQGSSGKKHRSEPRSKRKRKKG